MDICVLNPYFFPYQGGTEKVLLEIYRRLAKRHNVTVITSAERGKGRSVESVDGIRVVRLKSLYFDLPGLPLPFVSMIDLNRTIKKEDCDIYHINNRYQYYYGTIHAIKGMGRSLAITIHNSLPKGIGPFTDEGGLLYDAVWGRMIMHAADIITGVSKSAIATTVQKRDMRRAHLIYNGVDAGKFQHIGKGSPALKEIANGLDFGFGDGVYNIVTNARLTEQKGHPYLMRAIAQLVKEDGLNINLTIIGRGPLEGHLHGYAERLGISKNFRIVNGVSEEMLPFYYNMGDAFVLPSLYEPAGMAVLESMACEVPTIGTNVGGIPEMMDGCGFCVSPRSPEEIRERIKYVINNNGRTRELAERGRRTVIRRNDWDRIARQYEDLFLSSISY